MATDIELVSQGLFLGQQIASGTDKFRLVQARGKLLAFQDQATGRITSNAAQVLSADVQKRLRQRDAILKDLASHLVVLLASELKSLTGHQYATLSALAAMGHPYAKKKFRDARGRYNPRLKSGRAGLPSPPGAINTQSQGPANLTESFTFSTYLTPGGVYAVMVNNPLVYSGLLGPGTDTMIGRAYDSQAARLAQQEMTSDVKEAAAKLAALGESVPGLKAPEIDFNLGGVKRSYK
ncbi:MAG: hypothetical protein ACRYFS_03665 [Janthinobacterium lividum]